VAAVAQHEVPIGHDRARGSRCYPGSLPDPRLPREMIAAAQTWWSRPKRGEAGRGVPAISQGRRRRSVELWLSMDPALLYRQAEAEGLTIPCPTPVNSPGRTASPKPP
jgi:hypothetical protein